MYIACPKCDTKFVVTPEQIGSSGRQVRCSKCANVWHQKLDDQVKVAPLFAPTSIDKNIPPIGNGINLPALLPIRIPTYLYVLPFFIIGMIVFMFIMLFPGLFGFESILNNRNLTIKDIQIEKPTDLQKIIVSYKVLNSANHNIKLPLIRIRLFDKNGRVVKSLVDDHTNIDMSPNQFIQIKTEFMPAPPSADSIDVMIGNKIDFILR